jgi:hypothetical protein
MKAALMWKNGFPNMGVMIEIESSSLCLLSLGLGISF